MKKEDIFRKLGRKPLEKEWIGEISVLALRKKLDEEYRQNAKEVLTSLKENAEGYADMQNLLVNSTDILLELNILNEPILQKIVSKAGTEQSSIVLENYADMLQELVVFDTQVQEEPSTTASAQSEKNSEFEEWITVRTKSLPYEAIFSLATDGSTISLEECLQFYETELQKSLDKVAQITSMPETGKQIALQKIRIFNQPAIQKLQQIAQENEGRIHVYSKKVQEVFRLIVVYDADNTSIFSKEYDNQLLKEIQSLDLLEKMFLIANVTVENAKQQGRSYLPPLQHIQLGSDFVASRISETSKKKVQEIQSKVLQLPLQEQTNLVLVLTDELEKQLMSMKQIFF